MADIKWSLPHDNESLLLPEVYHMLVAIQRHGTSVRLFGDESAIVSPTCSHHPLAMRSMLGGALLCLARRFH